MRVVLGSALCLLFFGGLLVGSMQDSTDLPRDTLPAQLVGLELPLGLPEVIPQPIGNQFTVERLALGRKLFFDPILSVDRSVSCASCHKPEHGFSSPERFPAGVNGRRCARHAPTLLNRAFGGVQMWDGRVETLEKQVLMPIENPDEMGLDLGEAVARLAADAPYKAQFEEAFGDGVTQDNLARSLATFVRRLVAAGTAVDHFRSSGDRKALSEPERAGLWIYESKGGCWRCHSGPNFSDERLHNTGVGVANGVAEEGRFGFTGKEEDRGRFKTPTLRGLTYTAPYMHNGSLATLEDVVQFYRGGGNQNPQLDSRLKKFDLSDADAANLIAFLKALSRGSLDQLLGGK